MRRIMFDTETLGTSSSSVILSIAAVEFDDKNLGRRFHQRISIDSCLKHGLTVSGNTIEWWMGQSAEARKIFCIPGLPLDRVLIDLATWLDWSQVDEVWANGSDFDGPIIANAYRAIGAGNPPWAYFKLRDYRTIRKMYPKALAKSLEHAPAVKHDALEDAIAQALTLQALMGSNLPLRWVAWAAEAL
jgi:hypothetical protein